MFKINNNFIFNLKKDMNEVIENFLTFRNQIKLYHWKTKSLGRHLATDSFLSSFDQKTDRFIEEMIGKRDKDLKDKFEIKFSTLNDDKAKTYVIKFRDWLNDVLPSLIDEDETNLLNLKDEILGEVNKMIYLFRLK